MPKPAPTPETITAPFGKMPDGTPVEIYTLRNGHGMEARILTYGGTLHSLTAPDRTGRFGDIVLGFDDLKSYFTSTSYIGALVGRYANRIGGARFTLGGKNYTLAVNNGPNSLHGGIKGFDKVVWRAKSRTTADGPALALSYLSRDGEEGFPGNLQVTAVYTLAGANELRVDFTATTDRLTICNFTQHSYFNLRGQGNGDILGHQLYLNSDRITPVNRDLIPPGEYTAVDGTPFDFRKPTAIGARIDDSHPQLQYGAGYDHNYVINKPPGRLGLMARVHEPSTGRVLELESTEPGVQLYTGNYLDDAVPGKGGKRYPRRSGFCLEPQHYPDSPNKPMFPSVELKPGETFRSSIVYRLSAQ